MLWEVITRSHRTLYHCGSAEFYGQVARGGEQAREQESKSDENKQTPNIPRETNEKHRYMPKTKEHEANCCRPATPSVACRTPSSTHSRERGYGGQSSRRRYGIPSWLRWGECTLLARRVSQLSAALWLGGVEAFYSRWRDTAKSVPLLMMR